MQKVNIDLLAVYKPWPTFFFLNCVDRVRWKICGLQDPAVLHLCFFVLFFRSFFFFFQWSPVLIFSCGFSISSLSFFYCPIFSFWLFVCAGVVNCFRSLPDFTVLWFIPVFVINRLNKLTCGIQLFSPYEVVDMFSEGFLISLQWYTLLHVLF